MLTIDNCPITVEEVKMAQRFPPDVLDEELARCLLSAAEHCSMWMGRGNDFRTTKNGDEVWTSETIPNPVRRAVIMLAGRLFQSPNDSLNQHNSLVTSFLNPYSLKYGQNG